MTANSATVACRINLAFAMAMLLLLILLVGMPVSAAHSPGKERVDGLPDTLASDGGVTGAADVSAAAVATCTVPDMSALGRYHFEYGTTQGWFAQYGETKTGVNIVVTATTETIWTGHHSLRASASAAHVQDWWMAAAGLDDPVPGMAPTGTVTAHLYTPVTSTMSWAHLYILDQDWSWFNSDAASPQPGQWITLTWSLSPTMTRPIRRFGVQFGGNLTGPLDDALYVDTIDWSHPIYTHTIHAGAYLSETGTISFTDDLDWFDDVSGKHPGLINVFVGWTGSFPTDVVNTIIDHRSAPLVTWEPWVALTDVVNGDYDAYIDEWAQAISQTQTTVFLRLGHEMNGDWYAWSGNPEAFKNAWRYVHDRMEITSGVTNIAWVWTPNAQSVPDESWNAYYNYYPGDAYVDWVGASGYNAAGKATWDPKPTCRSFDDVFSTVLYDMADRYDKPQMVPEFASACDNGCEKTLWIAEAYYRARFYSHLRALVWFNVAKWEGEGDQRKWVDWRINCLDFCACCEEAYSQALANERYTGCPVAPLMHTRGPTVGAVHAAHTFTATISPLAESPTIYTWEGSEQIPIVHSGAMSDAVEFTWHIPGTKVVTVTATNVCVTLSATHTVMIAEMVYLPVVLRDH
jgi:hypothetical protein